MSVIWTKKIVIYTKSLTSHKTERPGVQQIKLGCPECSASYNKLRRSKYIFQQRHFSKFVEHRRFVALVE